MKKNSTSLMVPDEKIMNQIYFIRGQKIMLDRDLAELYNVETKVLKQAVKRNKGRFPQDFMFVMKKTELQNWRSQFVTSNSDQMGLRHLPFCFTEQGVAMLSSILNSDRAIKVNIQIIRIFTSLRKMLTDNTELRLEIEQIKKKLHKQGKSIDLVFKYLDELLEKQEIHPGGQKSHKQIGYPAPNKK